MAINRFTGIPESNLRPTTLPLPYQELLNTGLMRQQQYEQGEAQQYKLNSLLQSLKADPKAEFAKKIIDEKYNQRLLDLSNRVLDKGDVDYQREINQIASEYTNDPLVQTVNQRYANYSAYQQDRIKNSDKYVDFYDPYLNEGDILTPYSQTGQLNKFNYTGMDQRQDYTKRAEELMKGIEESGVTRELYERNPDGSIKYDELGQRRKIKQSQVGVLRSKVNQVAAQKSETFLNSAEGRFFLHEISGRGGFDYRDLNDTQKAQARALAQNYLAKIAENQISSKTVVSEDLDSLREDQLESMNTATNSTVDLGDVPLENITEINKFKVKVPSNFTANSNTSRNVTQGLASIGAGMYGPVLSPGTIKTSTEKEKREFKLNSEQQKMFERARTALGETAVSDIDKANIINKYIDKISKQAVDNSYSLLDPKTLKNENQYLFGTGETGGSGVSTRSVKLISGEGPKDGRGKDLLDEYGNKKKYNINVTGSLRPGNPFFEAGRIAIVTDAEGREVAKYAISGTNEEKNNNKIPHEFYKTKYNPLGTNTINLNGKKFELEFENITDGQTLNDDGTPIKVGERARLKDESGNVLREVESPGDAIFELYESFRKKK
jgi:hypothetical protein